MNNATQPSADCDAVPVYRLVRDATDHYYEYRIYKGDLLVGNVLEGRNELAAAQGLVGQAVPSDRRYVPAWADALAGDSSGVATSLDRRAADLVYAAGYLQARNCGLGPDEAARHAAYRADRACNAIGYLPDPEEP